jgi:branched-subunit amino acid transport protein
MSPWPAIVLGGAGTYLIRASFLGFARKFDEVPQSVQRVLRQIPPAVLAALVLPSFLAPEGSIDLWTPELVAGLIAAAVGWRTKSIAWTLLVGLAAVVILRELF